MAYNAARGDGRRLSAPKIHVVSDWRGLHLRTSAQLHAHVCQHSGGGVPGGRVRMRSTCRIPTAPTPPDTRKSADGVTTQWRTLRRCLGAGQTAPRARAPSPTSRTSKTHRSMQRLPRARARQAWRCDVQPGAAARHGGDARMATGAACRWWRMVTYGATLPTRRMLRP